MSQPPSTPDRTVPDTITELEFELVDPSYFFVALSKAASCRVRMEHLTRLFDGTLIEYFRTSGCSTEAILAATEAVDLIEDVRVLYEEDGETTFQVDVAGRCIAETIEGIGAIPLSILASDGVGRITAEVPRCIDPRAVTDCISRNHPNTELVARRQHDRPTPGFSSVGREEDLRDRLTGRQWEVLQTAFDQGYFDKPRKHTGEEIAEMLGISSPTFSEHLRLAQQRLMSMFLQRDGTSREDR